MSLDRETEFSRRYLRKILSTIPQPFCVMGGWSVYLTLNQKFESATGREYLRSRDIDLGFHFDPKWKRSEFENSPFNRAITKIQDLGFEAESFRFVKRYHLWEGRELTSEEGRHLPQYDIFNLYIDVLVDSKDPKRFELAGFSVLEESLLSKVFAGEDHVTTELEGISVMMPSPQLLMQMKIKSFPGRQQDDKRKKDLADLCALLLYSGSSPPTLGSGPQGRRLKARYESALNKTSEEEWEYVATALDIRVPVARRTARLIR